ncbi:MAG: hypothetical protein M1819_005707 [Sarea resinae]|nr:MAG: hypothetical protein M1819_005707 [Sarea resinae]
MDEAARGASALAAGKYTDAITHYTNALTTNPAAVDYYIKRSTAHQRVTPSNYSAALSDAEKAVVLAHKRGKRELIVQAQMRRGIALFCLERFADAGYCFSTAVLGKDEEPSLAIWQAKVQAKLKDLGDGDKRGIVTVREIPDVDMTDAGHNAAGSKTAENASVGKPDGSGTGQVGAGAAATTTVKQEGVQTPANKIRHDWYQTAENVVVTLLAKGVPKDKTTVEIHDQSISVSFPLPTGATFDFSLEPLFASIDPANSTHAIMSTKVELVLRKAEQGRKWSALESSPPAGKTTASEPSAHTAATPLESITNIPTRAAQPPSYPTSSRHGPKNWDKVAADLTKKPPKAKPASTADPNNSVTNAADDNENDVEDDDDEGGDPVNAFFRKLYGSADPDTRRAMMKSYQESNGTALSTNWAEVGKGKVETSPPDGMEEKKWDS